MTSKTKIVLGVFLGLVVAGVVIFYVIPGTVEQIAFSEQKKAYDKSAEGIANPMVAADGKAISRSDPCAFHTTSQGLANCRQSMANHEQQSKITQRNNEIYQQNREGVKSQLVTTEDNYKWFQEPHNNMVKVCELLATDLVLMSEFKPNLWIQSELDTLHDYENKYIILQNELCGDEK